METLLKLIQQNAERTGNRCGISLVKLAKASGFSIKETFQPPTEYPYPFMSEE